MLGSLLSSVFIFALDSCLHFSHLYLSVDSKVYSFKKLFKHFSKEFSKARLKVMKGLYVIDCLEHFPQVTIVFYIPEKSLSMIEG